MSDDFNPYRKWLGIPKNRMPANHYDILGVSLNEEDPEVIRTAAEQRRSYVEQQRGLGHDKAVKKILYQLDEAEMTLVDSELRRDYDKRLRLFKKRKKRRQVERVPGRSRVESRPGKTVGEDSGFARQFGAIVAILCVAFGAMYWWANRTYEPATGVSSPSDNTVADSHNVGNGGDGVPLPKPPGLGGDNSAKDLGKPTEPPADIPPDNVVSNRPVVTKPKPEVEIIETKSQDYLKSPTDYARAEGTKFSVGMGNQGGGYGIAAFGWRVKNAGSVEVNATLAGDIKVVDQDSFVGVVVDFRGPKGQWTKRVGINGFPQRLNRTNGVPNWGTRRKPDSILNEESAGDLNVSLEEHAPSDWTGESWVTVLMQNTGLNTGASGTVRFLPRAGSNSAPTEDSSRKSVEALATVTRITVQIDESGKGQVLIKSVPDEFVPDTKVSPLTVSVLPRSKFLRLPDRSIVAVHDFADSDSIKRVFNRGTDNVELDKRNGVVVLKPMATEKRGRQSSLNYGRLAGRPVRITCDLSHVGSAGFTLKFFNDAGMLQVKFWGTKLARQISWFANGQRQIELAKDGTPFEPGRQTVTKFELAPGQLEGPSMVQVGAFQSLPDSPQLTWHVRRIAVQGKMRPSFGVGLEKKGNRLIVNRILEESAADLAGLKEGDEVQLLNSTKVPTAELAVEILGGSQIGDVVRFQILRGGKRLSIDVVGG